jgi:hypothetical protein
MQGGHQGGYASTRAAWKNATFREAAAVATQWNGH